MKSWVRDRNATARATTALVTAAVPSWWERVSDVTRDACRASWITSDTRPMIDTPPEGNEPQTGPSEKGRRETEFRTGVSRLSAYAADRLTACSGIRAYGRRQSPGVE